MHWKHWLKKHFTSPQFEEQGIESPYVLEVEMLEERLVLSSLNGAVGDVNDLPQQQPNLLEQPLEQPTTFQPLDNKSQFIENTNKENLHSTGSSGKFHDSFTVTPDQTKQEESNILPEALNDQEQDPLFQDEQTGQVKEIKQKQIQNRTAYQSNPESFASPLTAQSLQSHAATNYRNSLSNQTASLASSNNTSLNNTIQNHSSAKWYADKVESVTVKYDFRDINGFENQITEKQKELATRALNAWSQATGNKFQFVQDTETSAKQIVNIGIGDLAALNHQSKVHGEIALSGVQISETENQINPMGIIWLDNAENWENNYNNGDVENTFDFFTVMAHEAGHIVGLDDLFRPGTENLMNQNYEKEYDASATDTALQNALFLPLSNLQGNGATGLSVHAMMAGLPQLLAGEVEELLEFGSKVSKSEDAIIAIVDRNGTILGVRAEQDVIDNFAGDPAGLAFAIDGAVAKARTAALFSNGDPGNGEVVNGTTGTFAPLTSRLVRFISQSTVTEREVNSNPNITDANSTVRGPGFIAPIGLGGHFPPDVQNTPPVDLFAIEHTNRDSLLHPGADGIKGTADDVTLRSRFNIDPNHVDAGQEIPSPESYGQVSGINPAAQSRGIATLPGGIPLFRDTNNDGNGDTLVGGVGVFFPGKDGYASYEQGFDPLDPNQTTLDRTNAEKVLEAEMIAFAIAGGSQSAATFTEIPEAKTLVSALHPLDDIDLRFGRLDLVGVQLSALGQTAGCEGVHQTVALASEILEESPLVSSGEDQIVNTGGDYHIGGESAAEGFLVNAHGSTVDDLTTADVTTIIDAAIAAAEKTRAAVRLEAGDSSPGARTRMVFAITDTTGEVLGLFRMQDATTFSIDVAVAKARNVAYYSDANDLQEIDQINTTNAPAGSPQASSLDVPGIANPTEIPKGTAFTNRTFRFLAEAQFPDGADGTAGTFSLLNNPSIDPTTGYNIGSPAAASTFTSVLGNDAFNPGTNFRDPGDAGVVADGGLLSDTANQNGIVFFPGSTPLYKEGKLIGGFGVSGDGVDQDDVVTFLGALGFLPSPETGQLRADEVRVDGVRLPYQKFLRNPFS